MTAIIESATRSVTAPTVEPRSFGDFTPVMGCDWCGGSGYWNGKPCIKCNFGGGQKVTAKAATLETTESETCACGFDRPEDCVLGEDGWAV
jgi:hypothetical protein